MIFLRLLFITTVLLFTFSLKCNATLVSHRVYDDDNKVVTLYCTENVSNPALNDINNKKTLATAVLSVCFEITSDGNRLYRMSMSIYSNSIINNIDSEFVSLRHINEEVFTHNVSYIHSSIERRFFSPDYSNYKFVTFFVSRIPIVFIDRIRKKEFYSFGFHFQDNVYWVGLNKKDCEDISLVLILD